MQTDRLTSIPPAIMKDFVDHYEMRGLLDSVESCIVHLDITSLDIHQVMPCLICLFLHFWTLF